MNVKTRERVITSKKTPVRGEYDVAVIGSGPAGLGAAVASARQGARTVLIERYGFMGGTMTAGLLNVMLGFFAKDKQVVGGIAQELVECLSAHSWEPLVIRGEKNAPSATRRQTAQTAAGEVLSLTIRK
jgi:glycine/D-amino acid oxidase-like deaminating enzyme